MKNKSNFWGFVGAITIIVLAGYFIFVLVIFLSKYIQNVSPNATAAFIAGIVTVIGYFITRNFERKKIIEQQIRDKKLPVCEEFIGFLFKIIMGPKVESPVLQEEINQFFLKGNKEIIVWFSDDVLKSYLKWRKAITKTANIDTNLPQNLSIFEDLLLAIRKDIGHNNKGLVKGDLLALFINDIDTFL